MNFTNNVSVSGYSYDQVEDIIEDIANQKAYQHRSIGYCDMDDIRQEVRIKCWNALPRFNSKCGTDLHVFLSVCSENRIRDIRRSILYKYSKPCFKCPFWDQIASQSGFHDCLVFNDKMDCEKYSKHEKYVQIKLSASHPIDIDNERIEDKYFDNIIDDLYFFDHIDANLPSGLSNLFNKLKINNFNIKALKPFERNALIPVLRLILKNFRGV